MLDTTRESSPLVRPEIAVTYTRVVNVNSSIQSFGRQDCEGVSMGVISAFGKRFTQLITTKALTRMPKGGLVNFESSSKSLDPSQRVIETIAEKAGRSSMELPCLYDVIDPEALDRLISSTNSAGSVTFQYNGFVVTVDGDGRLGIDDRQDR